MLISILIATRNRCAALAATLKAIGRVSIPLGARIEVLIADNGSTDQTKQVVHQASSELAQLRYFVSLEAGKAAALNGIIRQAKGDLFAFLDDDTIPEESWLTTLIRPLASGEADAVAGTVRLAPKLQRPWMTDLHRAWLADTSYLSAASPATAVGANMGMRREVFEVIPGFDPALGPGRLGLWEDTLLSLQIGRAGLKLVRANDSVVEHHFSGDRLLRAAFLQRSASEGRSSAYVAWHWDHIPSHRSVNRLLRWHIHLILKRITRREQTRSPEGMPEWEMNLLSGISFERYLRQARKEPRNYPRHGLRRNDARVYET